MSPETLALRERLWLPALSLPFQLCTVLGFLAFHHRVLPSAFGLTRQRFVSHALLGIGVGIVVTPLVLGCHYLVVQGYERVFLTPPQDHPLAILGKQSLSPLEWTMWFVAAIVAAPLMEEVFFRGLFQPWARQRPHGAATAVVLAVVLAVLSRAEDLVSAVRGMSDGSRSLRQVTDVLAPLIFVLLIVPPLFWARSLRGHQALLGTALLFAMVHTTVWPSPIALLLLALVLGWLREKTEGLVASIALHAVFNGSSCALLLLGWG